MIDRAVRLEFYCFQKVLPAVKIIPSFAQSISWKVKIKMLPLGFRYKKLCSLIQTFHFNNNFISFTKLVRQPKQPLYITMLIPSGFMISIDWISFKNNKNIPWIQGIQSSLKRRTANLYCSKWQRGWADTSVVPFQQVATHQLFLQFRGVINLQCN